MDYPAIYGDQAKASNTKELFGLNFFQGSARMIMPGYMSRVLKCVYFVLSCGANLVSLVPPFLDRQPSVSLLTI